MTYHIENIALAWGDFAPIGVQGIDENHQLYGNFIGVQFVFEHALDATILVEAIDFFLMQHPELTGRYDRKHHQVIPSQDRVWLRFQTGFEGQARDHASVGLLQERRSDFIFEPSRRKVQKGDASLTTFTLTTFEGGGCILGMAISHVLVDAAGFHLLAQYLGDIYSHKMEGKVPPDSYLVSELSVFKFGSGRSRRKTLKAVKQYGLTKPIKLKGISGGFIRNMIARTLDKMTKNKRIIIVFTGQDIARLKQAVLLESGEDWISTNIALCAHFTCLMTQFMFPKSKENYAQLGQLIDLRSKFFTQDKDQQANFIRNAILIYNVSAEFPHGFANVHRGDLASFFKRAIDKLDGPYLKERLDLIADCLEHGYSYPGLDFKTPMVALNNQSKMNVYGARFGDQTPLRVIPQDVGDNVMFFPTPEGGMEIYIRDIITPNRQAELLSPRWQARIYDFGGLKTTIP